MSLLQILFNEGLDSHVSKSHKKNVKNKTIKKYYKHIISNDDVKILERIIIDKLLPYVSYESIADDIIFKYYRGYFSSYLTFDLNIKNENINYNEYIDYTLRYSNHEKVPEKTSNNDKFDAQPNFFINSMKKRKNVVDDIKTYIENIINFINLSYHKALKDYIYENEDDVNKEDNEDYLEEFLESEEYNIYETLGEFTQQKETKLNNLKNIMSNKEDTETYLTPDQLRDVHFKISMKPNINIHYLKLNDRDLQNLDLIY